MGLFVLAQVIRDLIIDGDYMVECLEQREHGRVTATFALRSRAQPYTIQIETTDSRLEGLFRALLNGQGPDDGKNAVVKVGNQPVPVIEVDNVPADRPKERRRRTSRAVQAEASHVREQSTRAERRRSAMRELVMATADTSMRTTGTTDPARRRRRATASNNAENR
jgi:hypothetical protein